MLNFRAMVPAVRSTSVNGATGSLVNVTLCDPPRVGVADGVDVGVTVGVSVAVLVGVMVGVIVGVSVGV
jgi:hypothetical protein